MPQKTSWDKIEQEQLSPAIARRMVNGRNLTVAQFALTKGAVVPRHSHVNEQVTYLVSGALRFVFDEGELQLRGGEVLVIPPHEPHQVEVLEDSQVIDTFSPRREDWINKEDAYLRK